MVRNLNLKIVKRIGSMLTLNLAKSLNVLLPVLKVKIVMLGVKWMDGLLPWFTLVLYSYLLKHKV